MTSGTPESIQNWVLSGFQNSLDLASISCLDAKAISSSATFTSRPRGNRTGLTRQGRSAKPNKYRVNRLLSRGCVSGRLTQPELLIRYRDGCYAPCNMRQSGRTCWWGGMEPGGLTPCPRGRDPQGRELNGSPRSSPYR